ncbi:MAG: CoA transferase [Alphaproteobacteria bacterium]|nr:CoA transferase [Alphaproteobacteria bacterium]
MASALEGIKILDLSRVLAGPIATQILGDLGADIIKIEKPGSGDDTRSWGPPFLKDTRESAYYLSANRNKKSLTLDIATPEGQAIIHRLLENSDVLIENFKVGGLKKYGLDYDSLKEKYPALVYCSITGYGHEGPLAKEPGYDVIAQAMGGLMAATGEANGAPMKTGVALADVMSGLYAVIGILSALRSGKGQHIDIALLNVTLAGMTNLAQYYLTSGAPAPRQGNQHATIVPYQAFEAKDGYVVIAIGNDHQFEKFAGVLDHPEWASDTRFSVNSARVENRQTLIPLIADIIHTKPVDRWVATLRARDIPAGPVNTMDKVFAEAQIATQDMRITLPHPGAPQGIDLIGNPLKLSDTPVSYRAAPPTLGQHTDEILREIGYDTAKIKELHDAGII